MKHTDKQSGTIRDKQPSSLRRIVRPHGMAIPYVGTKPLVIKIKPMGKCQWAKYQWAHFYDMKTGKEVWSCNTGFAKTWFSDVPNDEAMPDGSNQPTKTL